MGMTIDEAIQILERHHMWTGEPQEVTDVRVENKAMQTAIDTMRKYQKIVQIVSLNDEEFKQCGLKELKEILEVITDRSEE